MTRDEQGRYEAAHDADPDAVLAAMDGGEMYTTGELADAVDAPRRTVYNYLRTLVERGAVTRKDPNDRLTLWGRADD